MPFFFGRTFFAFRDFERRGNYFSAAMMFAAQGLFLALLALGVRLFWWRRKRYHAHLPALVIGERGLQVFGLRSRGVFIAWDALESVNLLSRNGTGGRIEIRYRRPKYLGGPQKIRREVIALVEMDYSSEGLGLFAALSGMVEARRKVPVLWTLQFGEGELVATNAASERRYRCGWKDMVKVAVHGAGLGAGAFGWVVYSQKASFEFPQDAVGAEQFLAVAQSKLGPFDAKALISGAASMADEYFTVWSLSGPRI